MAAEQGVAEAQYNLGICLFYGNGCEKNPEEAVKWFRMAAEQEHADAQFSLGTCLDKGIGCEKNPEEAENWFRMAEQGKKRTSQQEMKLLFIAL